VIYQLIIEPRTLTKTGRLIILVFASVAAAILSYLGIRNALAEHYSDQGTLAGYRRAVQLEPQNAKNWYLLGRYLRLELEHPDSKVAVRALKMSLSLDPRSARTWLELASVYEDEGSLDAAREAFIRAKNAYPRSAEVAWRYGNFLLRTGEAQTAVTEIYQAVQEDPKFGLEAFSALQRLEPNIDSVLNRDLPHIPSVYLDILWGLYDYPPTDVPLKVWSLLFELRKTIPQGQVPEGHFQQTRQTLFSLVDKLIRNGPISEAGRVWGEVLMFLHIPQPNDPPDSLVWDGGFETDITGGGFSWRLPALGSMVRYDRDTKQSGKRSLRVRFDGKRNVDFHDVCQFILVSPQVEYDFSAWLRTDAITTNNGIFLRLNTPFNDATGAITPQVTGTIPWTRFNIQWKATSNVHVLEVCLVRLPSQKLDNRISGSVWLDDVALVPRFRGPNGP
jgi:tetratricopeptide (TPR) repeat protein